jgi:hypothetical protein
MESDELAGNCDWLLGVGVVPQGGGYWVEVAGVEGEGLGRGIVF